MAAAVRAEQVLGAVRAVMAEERQIDLLALPLPADLRYVAEFAAGALDGRTREPVAILGDVQAALATLDSICDVPWLLLADGEPEVWLTGLRLAAEHGACGFVAGASTWSDAPAEDVTGWLAGDGLQRWRRAIALSAGGRSWQAPRRSGGDEA
ncbi:MAG: hypothetical protein M5U09_22255 [Gammaproteobacteria bacterium]|nr:hypothetical protein [Gammaproteobacteria bacterium]